MRIGAAGRSRERSTRSPAVEGVKAGRRHDPVVPADIFEGHEERFSTALGHGCPASGRRVPLLARVPRTDLGRSL